METMLPEVNFTYCNQHDTEIRLQIVRVGLSSLMADNEEQYKQHFQRILTEQTLDIDNFDSLVQMRASIATHCALEMGIQPQMLFAFYECPMCKSIEMHGWWCREKICEIPERIAGYPKMYADAMLKIWQHIRDV